MKSDPSVETLNESGDYVRIASVEQHAIKDFVWQQVMADKRFVPAYMIYQTLLLLSGMFFLTRSVVLAFKGNTIYLLISLGTIFFCFTFLVAIHEFLHGLALKLVGAPRVTFGAILRKFLFFAEADRFVMGRGAFFFVAFTPLVIIQLVAIAGIIYWFSSSFVYFFLLLMTIHSFFCAGDVALASVFNRFPGRAMYTYDVSSEKRSYYFVKKESRTSAEPVDEIE